MRITFLEASMPLVKRFELDSKTGELIKHPYPNAYEFTSHTEDIPDLPTLAKQIEAHGALGHCLLKGVIGRNLQAESRAGSTDASTPTDWACFDLDGAMFASPDDFLISIGIPDVSYVLQWSASHGLDPKAQGLRCHLFFQLSQAQNPALIKQHLQNLNLTIPGLRIGTKLTKTACALTWPLDITTCQNDKLIYIAPPTLGTGLHDPLPKRVMYVPRARNLLELPAMIPSQSALRIAMDKRINELRQAGSLPPRKTTQYKHAGAVEYLSKPEIAVVTGTKVERGFVYLNLNGGDSWGYYHPEDNCEVIYNFKGEPNYLTKELCPEYYHQARESSNTGTKIYLAFRDFTSSKFFNGYYDEAEDTMELKEARTENQLRDYLKQYGKELGDFVPTWKMLYDPHDPVVINLKNDPPTLNTFMPTDIMKRPVVPRDTLPPFTQKVVSNMLGHDEAVIDEFNNWVACMLQFKKPNMTAWCISGIQGTGKGAFMQKVMMPILTTQHMHIVRMEELESDFTHVFENKLLVVIDEIHVASSQKQEKVMAKLKNLLVEPMINIRRMYRESYMAPNYMSAIVTSNKFVPIEVESSDRRFHVAPYADTPLGMTKQQVEEVLPTEAYDAYCFWMSYPADPMRAMKPIQTENRKFVMDASISSADHISAYIHQGNLKELYDLLPTNDEEETLGARLSDSTGTVNARAKYKALMRELVTNLPDKLTRDDLHTIFRYCVGNTPASPHKFTSYLRHHNLHVKEVRVNGKTVRGIEVKWTVDPAWLFQARAEI